MNVIAYNLKRLREAKGVSQQALGATAGLPSTAHVSHIESGRIEDPNSKTLKKLAEALEVTMADFFTPIPDEEAPGDSAA